MLSAVLLSSRLRRASVAWLLCAAFGSVAVLNSAVTAEQRELKTEDTGKMDAVLLLDASGSMLRTDPTRLRDEGAKLFLQFLKPGDRVAVVQFSATASVIRPFTAYAPEAQAEISADIGRVSTDGTYTDLYVGIKEAAELLKREKRPEALGTVLLLSDGKMDPDPSVAPQYTRTDELLNSLLPELKAAGIRVNTLAMSDQADKQLLSEIAIATEAVGVFAPTSEEIHRSFAELFLVVKKPQVVPLTGKGFTIDGDVQEATFYINREEGKEIALISPSGKEFPRNVEPEQGKWFTGTNFDVVTIFSPESGDWTVRGLASAESFATVLTNLKLVSDWSSTITAGIPAVLQARLNEGEKPVVLKEMSAATRYALQIIPTDKVSEPVIEDLLYDDGTRGDKIAGDGIFSYRVQLEEPGEYKLWIVAKGPTFDRRQQIPFKVKPPIISVRIEEEEISDLDLHGATVAHGGSGDAAGAHGEAGGGAEGHATSESNAESHTAESPAEHSAVAGEAGADASEKQGGNVASATPQTREFIKVVLSTEALALRNVEVKLTAVDSNRRRFVIPLSKGKDELEYEVAVSALPGVGEFVLQATIDAETKRKGSLKEQSKPLKYVKKEGAANDLAIVEVLAEKKVEASGQLWWPWTILLLAANGGAGFVLLGMLRKAQSKLEVSLPEFVSAEPGLAVIAALEGRMQLVELDFNDPLLKNEVIVPASLAGGSPGMASSQPAAAPAAEPEVATPTEAIDAAPVDGADGAGEPPPEGGAK